MKKKLIEVALPLDAINRESAREKSIRHGHPSTLHLWWARRPLAAARAVIWSSLVDDPSSHPEQFPTEEEQNAERQRLFKILEDLVVWENSNNEDVLNRAKDEIWNSTDGNPPPLLDPFAGGGSIPLEAQRLGLEAHAHDLNPVAVMINKAMIEIPPKFAGMPPVNPESRKRGNMETGWKGAAGLAEDVSYYGEWMKQEAFKRIGHLYPKVKDKHGQEHTVIAWIWTRTVKCPNPVCGYQMPLASSFILSKKKGNEACIIPILDKTNKQIKYRVRLGKGEIPETGKTARGAKFKCIMCGESTTPDYIKSESMQGRMGSQLTAIVGEGEHGRVYISPNETHELVANVEMPNKIPHGEIGGDRRALWTPLYGLTNFEDLFTNRQLTALTTFSALVAEAQEKAEADAIAAGVSNAKAYGQAVGVYLAFVVDRQANYSSSLNAWGGDFIVQTFGRQALPMVWDYAESNPFSNSTGCWSNALGWVCSSMLCSRPEKGIVSCASQFDAQSNCKLRNIMFSTDPPYYDNIGYADLSDYFYICLPVKSL